MEGRGVHRNNAARHAEQGEMKMKARDFVDLAPGVLI